MHANDSLFTGNFSLVLFTLGLNTVRGVLIQRCPTLIKLGSQVMICLALNHTEP